MEGSPLRALRSSCGISSCAFAAMCGPARVTSGKPRGSGSTNCWSYASEPIHRAWHSGRVKPDIDCPTRCSTSKPTSIRSSTTGDTSKKAGEFRRALSSRRSIAWSDVACATVSRCGGVAAGPMASSRFALPCRTESSMTLPGRTSRGREVDECRGPGCNHPALFNGFLRQQASAGRKKSPTPQVSSSRPFAAVRLCPWRLHASQFTPNAVSALAPVMGGPRRGGKWTRITMGPAKCFSCRAPSCGDRRDAPVPDPA